MSHKSQGQSIQYTEGSDIEELGEREECDQSILYSN